MGWWTGWIGKKQKQKTMDSAWDFNLSNQGDGGALPSGGEDIAFAMPICDLT